MQTNYQIKEEKAKAGTGATSARLALLEELTPSQARELSDAKVLGRNLWTRIVDIALAFLRTYTPPIHWLVCGVMAIVLFIYARLVALTIRLTATGERRWPDLPAPCVLALWHRNAPSLLVAFAKHHPRSTCVIMVAGDPRGDIMALLCRLLGFAVVRGSSEEGGWKALSELGDELDRGACVVITVDGGGPARVAKIGAVVLAAAARVPLVPLSVDCHPAISEPHKWDAARNPVPFGSVTVTIGPANSFEQFVDHSSLEQARRWVEQTLNALG